MKKLLAFATIAALLCGCESDPGVVSLDDGDVATMNFSITNTDDIGVGEEIGIYIFDQSGETIEGKENLRYVVGDNGVLTPSSDDDIFYRKASVARSYHAYYPYDESLSTPPVVNINTADQTDAAAYAKRSCLIADDTSYGVAFEMGYIPNVYRIKFTTADTGITGFDASNITSVKYCGSYTESNFSLSNLDSEASSFTHVDGSVKDLVMENDGDSDPLTYRVAVIPNSSTPSQNLIKVVYNDGDYIYAKDLSWDGVEPTDGYIETPLNFSDATTSAVPDEITISGTPTENIDVIGTATLSATLTSTESGEVDESSFAVTWSSDEPLVVSVDDSGNITALREGSAKITASVESLGISADVTIAVNALKPFSYVEFLAGGIYETIVPSSNEWVISDENITGLDSGWTEIKAAIVKYAELYKDEELSITFSNMTKNLRTSALAFTEGEANPIVALSFPEHTNAIASGSIAYMPKLRTIYAPKIRNVNGGFIGCTSLESFEVSTYEGLYLGTISGNAFCIESGNYNCDYKLIVGETLGSASSLDISARTLTYTSSDSIVYTFNEIETKDNSKATEPTLTDGVTLKVDGSEVTSATTLDLFYGGSDITAVASVVANGAADSAGVTWESGDDTIATVTGGVVSIAENATPGESTTITAKSVTDPTLTQTFNVEVKFGAFTLANLTAWDTAGYTPPIDEEWVITDETISGLVDYLTGDFTTDNSTAALTITFSNATSAPSTFMKDVEVIDVINMPLATVIYQSAFNGSSVTEVYAPKVTEIKHSTSSSTAISFRNSSLEKLSISSAFDTSTLSKDAFIITNKIYECDYDLYLIGDSVTDTNISVDNKTIKDPTNDLTYTFNSITLQSAEE